jgi:hypothetical protein
MGRPNESERRSATDRRGEDRRKQAMPVAVERRSGIDRRSGRDRRNDSAAFARYFAVAFAE